MEQALIEAQRVAIKEKTIKEALSEAKSAKAIDELRLSRQTCDILIKEKEALIQERDSFKEKFEFMLIKHDKLEEINTKLKDYSDMLLSRSDHLTLQARSVKENISSILSKYPLSIVECFHCQNPISNPITFAPCSHSMCESCYESLPESENSSCAKCVSLGEPASIEIVVDNNPLGTFVSLLTELHLIKPLIYSKKTSSRPSSRYNNSSSLDDSNIVVKDTSVEESEETFNIIN